MALMIVESPTKIKTLAKILGNDWQFVATRGHIYDLPEKDMGLEKDYTPRWVTDDNKTVNYIRKQAKDNNEIFIASDPDREGEAIAWQVSELILKNRETSRARLNSITRDDVEEEISNPGKLDTDMVRAQWARRILDRLAGYKISPFLINAFKGKKLSAGRVQSAVLARIVERHREVEAFEPETFYNIEALVQPDKNSSELNLKAKLTQIDDEKIGTKEDEKLLTDRKRAENICATVRENGLVLKEKKSQKTTTNPSFPLDSSAMLQLASSWFNWPAGKTMNVAQSLYEKGLITYHRSDSSKLSRKGCKSAAAFINDQYGSEFHQWRGGGGGEQEGHEAIRAQYAGLKPDDLHSVSSAQRTLYGLIWLKYIQSQMKAARWNKLTLLFQPPEENRIIFKGEARSIEDEGFYRCQLENQTAPPEKELTRDEFETLKNCSNYLVEEVEPHESQTRGPSNFTEGSLVQMMKQEKIGRPSTYASTIKRLFSRRYIDNEKGKIIPTPRGVDVIDFLSKTIPAICEVQFTRKMEEELDRIAEGEEDWQKYVKEFDQKLESWLEEAEGAKPEGNAELKHEILDYEVCPRCEGNLILREGKYGEFVHCEEEDCDFSSNPPAKTYLCPICERHMIKRKGKKSTFYNCIAYPECEGKRPVAERDADVARDAVVGEGV
ncbi:MAG: type I DNA topoisomerase, partial [bacterium]